MKRRIARTVVPAVILVSGIFVTAGPAEAGNLSYNGCQWTSVKNTADPYVGSFTYPTDYDCTWHQVELYWKTCSGCSSNLTLGAQAGATGVSEVDRSAYIYVTSGTRARAGGTTSGWYSIS